MSTTKDPVRLVWDPSCPESERQLLRHGVSMQPPHDAEARVWRGLVGTIGAAAVAGSAEASAKTAAATTATKIEATGLAGSKIVALLVALAALAALAAVVALGDYLVASPRDPRPPASAPQPAPAAATTTPAPTTPAPTTTTASTPTPAWVAPAPVDDTAPARPARARPRSHLREEVTYIKDARQALRQGDAARALQILDDCRRHFPSGVLEQERERLSIDALVALGRGPEAAARAGAFLRAYPDSPHAGEVRAVGLAARGSR
jgi:hypothetical protein